MEKINYHREHVVRTVCNSHCGGLCELKVYVIGNRVSRIEAGDDDEEGRPRACLRGRAYRQRIYAPDRLLYPLKRTGEKGAGEFARVSWDEALGIIASAMKRVKAMHGNASILHFCSMADAHVLNHVQAFHKLLCMFGGYTAPWGTISNEGANFAAGVTHGKRYEMTLPAPEDYLNSKLIIMWGWNPATTQMGTNYPYYLARAKENGARIIALDPVYTDSAATFAEQWIPIRPGTDTAVLLAMAYVIVREDLQDKRFIDLYTYGFELFKDYLLGLEDGEAKTPEWAEVISGVPAKTIAGLAREYALTKPAILGASISAGRSAFGEQFHRAVYALEAITGNVIFRNVNPVPKVLRYIPDMPLESCPPNQVETGAPPRWNALPTRGNSVNSSARVNVNLLADAIIKGKEGGYPADYKLLWLSNTNYLNQLGDINKAVQAFKKLDFLLVTEQFMTATARYADIVLPVNTFLERSDLHAPRSGDEYGIVNKAIESEGESMSQLEICEALALKLGISNYNDKTDREWVKAIISKMSEIIEFPNYETMKKQGIYRICLKNRAKKPGKLSEKAGKHATPSGRIELYSQLVAGMNHPLIPPLPKYMEPWEGLNDPLVEKYPLQLITPHFKRRAHSQFDNLPWLKDLQTQAVLISSSDAELRNIRDGDMVRIFNNRGEMIIQARVTERITPGTVAVPQGAWYSPGEDGVDYGGSANILTKNVTSPAGAFTSNTALVQVEGAD